MEYDIVGINEIADMAGVSRQAVVNWRTRSADFPRPMKELSSGPVFRRSQVRAWLGRNNKRLEDLQKASSFYPRLKSYRHDDEKLSECIYKVTEKLKNLDTSNNSPGMLLGKIQSGKTRAFVGVIACAFDNCFDIALVLTKGTKTLSEQTVKRLSADFVEFIDEDELMVLDIMKLPGTLTKSELRRKIVIVAKKQKQNLIKLIEFMNNQQGLQKRKVLIIDDEADLASIRFVRKKGDEDIIQGTIADQIDELRNLSNGIAFLQVTATPYSLYLQPENYDDSLKTGGFIFKPKRPTFTELLPIHSGYVGGEDYFGSHDNDDLRSKLIVEVSVQEQDALRKSDQRKISQDRILLNPNTVGIRRAITTFIVASGIRQWQQRELGEKEKKYSMVIHNDVQKAAHAWQNQVVDWIFKEIINAAEHTPDLLRPMFDEAFNDLTESVATHGSTMPPYDEAFNNFIDALQNHDVVVEEVNSDNDVMALLDQKAELRLRTPYNIFVGGNILDRGITIPNMIAFYYGRNPKTMQADTVLQHSRMYGNRPQDDLAVTRFYTSRSVFDRLYTINGFENVLRNAFESGAHEQGVAFIQTDATRRVKPCAPNKLLLSNVVAVSPDTMLLPSDFQTIGGDRMAKIQNKLDKLIKPEWRDTGEFISVSHKKAFEIIDIIKGSMEFDSVKFEWDAMRSLVEYYAREDNDEEMLLIAETGRKLNRAVSGDKSGKSILGVALRDKVINQPRSKPALILLQQKGGRDLGWSAHSFWWPLLAVPTDAEPCVFATKSAA